jgi:hypothetical protein
MPVLGKFDNLSSYSRFDERYRGPGKIGGVYNTDGTIPEGNVKLTPEMLDPYNWNKYFNPNYGKPPPKSAYESAQELARGSQAGEAVLGQYLAPGLAYTQGYTGPMLKSWNPQAAYGITKAVQQESALLGKMKAQESTYDKAFAEAQKAQEMAKTKTGVIEAGSAAQKVIAGGTGAGQEKAGAFKGIYGAGSLLPASWMQSKLDPTKVAQKVSGLEDRNAAEQLRVGGGDTRSQTLTYGRSEFKAPTLQKTGLGRYATIK